MWDKHSVCVGQQHITKAGRLSNILYFNNVLNSLAKSIQQEEKEAKLCCYDPTQ